jgi:CspA family cold shock protein
MHGTIKIITTRGFGFILGANGQDYFFHESACVGTPFSDLRVGQAVTFDEGMGPKGRRADNVKAA